MLIGIFPTCIEADKVDIIEEPPLLIVMIRTFGDFPLHMWGYTRIDVWTEDENKKRVYCGRKEKSLGSFNLISRQTFTADAIRIPVETPTPNAQRCAQPRSPSSCDDHSSDTPPESEDIHFLKSAWPEMKRQKEPEVIREAYKRAEALLGTEARSATDHLPVLINFEGLAYTSTEIIRRLVNSSTADGFCVQLWMLSKKLQLIYLN